MNSKYFLRINFLVAIMSALFQASVPAIPLVRAATGHGEIEFRLAERANKPRSSIPEFITVEFWGLRYRVAKRPELTLQRADLTEVLVRETSLGYYALQLGVHHSLWTAVELMTTAYQGNHLAIFVDGSLVLVATVEIPIPDGRLLIDLYGRSKEEVFDLGQRFSRTPEFLPLEPIKKR